MSFDICINYVLIFFIVVYAANTEFLSDTIEKVNPTLVTCIIMCSNVQILNR